MGPLFVKVQFNKKIVVVHVYDRSKVDMRLGPKICFMVEAQGHVHGPYDDNSIKRKGVDTLSQLFEPLNTWKHLNYPKNLEQGKPIRPLQQ